MAPVRTAKTKKLTENEIRQLHGIGPNALDELRRALAANGLSYAGAPKANKTAGSKRTVTEQTGAKRR